MQTFLGYNITHSFVTEQSQNQVIELIVERFAKHCITDKQKKSLAELLSESFRLAHRGGCCGFWGNEYRIELMENEIAILLLEESPVTTHSAQQVLQA